MRNEDDERGIAGSRSVAQLSKWSESQDQKPPKVREAKVARAPEEVPSMSQSRSIAQLSKWSEAQDSGAKAPKERVVKETVSIPRAAPPPAAKVFAAKEKDDDYDDDFEDYNDDFNEEEEPAPVAVSKSVPPKAVPAATTLSFIQSSRPSSSSQAKSSSASPVVPDLPSGISEREIAELRRSMELENAEAIQRRTQEAKGGNLTDNAKPPSRAAVPKVEDSPAPQAKAAQAKRTKKFGELSLGVGSGSLNVDPRGRRISKLVASGVLDMQEEKFTTLNLAPSTSFDLYHRMLRTQPASIKQIGVPSNEETRDVEIGTDEIVMVDREVQYTYGDDTAILNLMKLVSARKTSKPKESLMESFKALSTPAGSQSTASTSTDTSDIFGSTSARLSVFLQRSSQLCEAILDEQQQRWEERSKVGDATPSNARRVSLFDSQSPWIPFGEDISSGANEMIRNRRVVYAKFSSLQTNLFMTAHPFEIEDVDDLRPGKGLYCVWDVLAPSCPLHILEATGNPTCCSFSGVQTFVLIAGSAEGTVYLWDLREPTHLHKDKEAKDLGIEKGVRKPCYSTTVLVNAQRELDIDQHSSAIVQIDPVGHEDSESLGSSIVSQFVSLDLCGSVVLWVTAESGGDSSVVDLGLSPWSRLALVQMRVLRLGTPNLSDLVPREGSKSSDSSAAPRRGEGVGQSPVNSSVLSTVPGDMSTFLMSAPKGQVCKLVRFGENRKSGLSTSFGRLQTGDYLEIPLQRSGGGSIEKIEYTSTVTCIAARQTFQASADFKLDGLENSSASSTPLVLVGRSDGGVDLHRLHDHAPLQSWVLSHFSDDTKSQRSPAVIFLKWFPKRSSAFIAGDERGRLFFFDLLLNPFSPVQVDSLPARMYTRGLVDVSFTRPGSRAVYILAAPNGKPSSVQVRRVSDTVLQCVSTGSRFGFGSGQSDALLALSGCEAEDALLKQSLDSWAARTSLNEDIVLLGGNSRAK